MRTRESEGERQGGAWRLRGVEEEAGGGQGEAGGGRGLSGARHASPLFVLLAEEEEDKGEEVGWAGWAGQMELGQALVGCTVRPGNLLLSLSFSNYLSFLLFCKFRALLKILRHFQKS